MHTIAITQSVAFLLIQDERLLVEKRKENRFLDPGKIAIPGGHINSHEASEDALVRELREELGVTSKDFQFLCTLIHQSEEYQRIDYFVILSWEGKIQNNEAENLHWITLREVRLLDIPADRVALREYKRHFLNGDDA